MAAGPVVVWSVSVVEDSATVVTVGKGGSSCNNSLTWFNSSSRSCSCSSGGFSASQLLGDRDIRACLFSDFFSPFIFKARHNGFDQLDESFSFR